jgi:hypothetical protein
VGEANVHGLVRATLRPGKVCCQWSDGPIAFFKLATRGDIDNFTCFGGKRWDEYLRRNMRTYSSLVEWVAASGKNLTTIYEGLPVAYLTAHMALSLAGFQAGKTVLFRGASEAIGGGVHNRQKHE